jgi:hypothetical protein
VLPVRYELDCKYCYKLASISQLTVSRLSRQCGILNISQPYRLPRPVTGITLLYFYFLYPVRQNSSLYELTVKYDISCVIIVILFGTAARLRAREAGVRFLVDTGLSSLTHNVQTLPGVYQISYPVCT